jgi:hypothetical protein
MFHGAQTHGVFDLFIAILNTLYLVTYKWKDFISHDSAAEKSMKKTMADFLEVSAGSLFLIFVIFVSSHGKREAHCVFTLQKRSASSHKPCYRTTNSI